MRTPLDAATAYLRSGLSVIPIRTDGSKSPDLQTWKPFQSRQPTDRELQHWFGNGTMHGIAIVWGKISGNGECIDFDMPGLYEQFEALCREHNLAELLDRIPLVGTPSGGRHLYYRCVEAVSGNAKLAQRQMPEGKVETMIETRAEGGYSVAPGSPPECHPDRKTYQFLRGHSSSIPTISGEQRSALLALAVTFNQYVKREAVRNGPDPQQGTKRIGFRPGDDYNERGEYESLLERHGWRRMGGDARGLWQRPGKQGCGISATSNYGGSGLFYVFSSNAAPFEAQTAYSPFAVFTLLEHGGNWAKAARELGEDGYGAPSMPPILRNGMQGGSLTEARAEAVTEWETPVTFSAQAVPAFPLEAMPAAMAAYVAEVAQTTQVPPDMPGMLAIAAVAAAGARTCLVQIGQTHTEPLNLYVAVVMEPGSRKTATHDAMTAPLRKAEQEMAAKEMPIVEAAREQRAVEEKRILHLREQAAKTKEPDARAELIHELGEAAADMVEVPSVPRLLADDVTPEKLAALMAEQDGTMALFSAEGGIFSILAGRYTQNGQANLDLFLKGHAGEDYRVDRQGRPSVSLPRACLTMGLAVQPDVLASLADSPSFRGRGLLGRFLYSLPENLVGTRFYQNRPVDEAARSRYAQTIQSILDIPSAATEEDPAKRNVLTITGRGLDVWETYYNDVERRQADGGDLAGVRDWASKLAGAVARIAAGFHLAEHSRQGRPRKLPISPETVAAAWAIGEYLIPHALAAFGQMGANPDQALAIRLLRWIERKDRTRFTLRECHQAHRGVPSPQGLLPALTLLCERGYLREVSADPGPKGGRPKGGEYEVNPLTQNRTKDTKPTAGL